MKAGHDETGRDGTRGLCREVTWHTRPREVTGRGEAERDCRVEVGAADVADGVDHHHDDAAEGDGHERAA